MTFRAFWYGCWWTHGDVIREHDEDGVMVLRCLTCDSVHTPDLSRDKIRGAAHEPAEVLGTPNVRVQRHADRTKVWRIK